MLLVLLRLVLLRLLLLRPLLPLLLLLILPLSPALPGKDVCSWLAVHPLADDLSIADDETDMEEVRHTARMPALDSGFALPPVLPVWCLLMLTTKPAVAQIEDLRGAPCSHFFTVLKLAGLRDPGCVAARSKQQVLMCCPALPCALPCPALPCPVPYPPCVPCALAYLLLCCCLPPLLSASLIPDRVLFHSQVAFVAGLRNNKKGHSHRESGLHFDFHNQGHVHDQVSELLKP